MTIPPLQEMLARASTLAEQGLTEAAILAYQRLLGFYPTLADCWASYGALLGKDEQYQASVDAYMNAIKHEITCAEQAWLKLAGIYLDGLHDTGRAALALHSALEVNPTYRPALLALAGIRNDQGDTDTAAVLYDQLLEISRHDPEVLARRATLCRIRHKDAPMIGRLRQALQQPRLQPVDKARLGFALGRLLEDQLYPDRSSFTASSRPNR